MLFIGNGHHGAQDFLAEIRGLEQGVPPSFPLSLTLVLLYSFTPLLLYSFTPLLRYSLTATPHFDRPGTAEAGLPIAAKYAKRALTLASIAVGDVSSDILYLLKNEIEGGRDTNLNRAITRLMDKGYTLDSIATKIASSQ